MVPHATLVIRDGSLAFSLGFVPHSCGFECILTLVTRI
jgi:hypothetical protein